MRLQRQPINSKTMKEQILIDALEEIKKHAEKLEYAIRVDDRRTIGKRVSEIIFQSRHALSLYQSSEQPKSEVEELKKEIERLKELVELAHSEGYDDATHHVEYSTSLKDFKIENNL
jgi:hypothetical protein